MSLAVLQLDMPGNASAVLLQALLCSGQAQQLGGAPAALTAPLVAFSPLRLTCSPLSRPASLHTMQPECSAACPATRLRFAQTRSASSRMPTREFARQLGVSSSHLTTRLVVGSCASPQASLATLPSRPCACTLRLPSPDARVPCLLPQPLPGRLLAEVYRGSR